MFEPCLMVKERMDKFGYPWFIAGGWAIDLFLGRETRAHGDLEIGIYRADQMRLQRYFAKAKKRFVDNRNYTGKRDRREWTKEYLRLPIHEIYLELGGLELEVLLNEKEEDRWVYRRDPGISLDLSKVILYTKDEIPYLCPEIVALYKTKCLEERDRDDIRLAWEKMDDAQRLWLVSSVKDKPSQEWLSSLASKGRS